MNYIKSLAKSVYETVLEDEYLEKLSEQELYYIINNTTRKRLLSHGQDARKLSDSESNQELLERIDMIGNVSPEREFRMFGVDTNMNRIVERYNELSEIEGEVSGLMMSNFEIYEGRMNLAIREIDGIKSLYGAKKLTLQMKDKLLLLQEVSKKAKKITELNIKVKNLKSVLKTLGELPNLKKMSLTELKTINPDSIKQKANLSKLLCLSTLSTFIESAVTSQLNRVILILEECLVIKFEEKLYENALKDFILTQSKSVKYSNLLKKLLQKELHKIGTFSTLIESCKFLIQLLQNVHCIFRWHRTNEKEDYWQNLSVEHYKISIEISAKDLTDVVMAGIDEAIKEQILHQFYKCENTGESLGRILEDFYLLMRIVRITALFSGGALTQTLRELTEYMHRRLIHMKEKSKLELDEIYRNEERNNWNRLPVVDDYSHDGVDRGLYQIYGHMNGGYGEIVRALRDVKSVLKGVKLDSLQENGDLWESEWLKIKGSETEEKEIEEDTESWEIEALEFPEIEKFEKNKHLIKPDAKIYRKEELNGELPQSPASNDKQQSIVNCHTQTIICQYSLNILKQVHSYINFCFYFPLEPIISESIKTAEEFIENYIYQMFNCFMSSSMRDLLMCEVNEKMGLDWRYHKKRLHVQYPNVAHFIRAYEKDHKFTFKRVSSETEIPSPTKPQRQSLSSSQEIIASEAVENMEVRSRVVALESFAYLIKHYENILSVAGLLNPSSPSIGTLHPIINSYLQKRLSMYKTLYPELSELIYTDNIPKLCKLKTTSSFIESIKWNDEELQIAEYVQIFAQKCKDFYYKMISSNRGEVPLGICERLYGIFWKTQLTHIMKAFMGCYKAGRNIYSVQNSGKNKLERFIDMLYDNLALFVQEKSYIHYPYERIKEGFPVLLESNFEKAFQLLQQSLLKFEFIYVVEVNLLLTSESCCYLSQTDIEDKKKLFEELVMKIVQ